MGYISEDYYKRGLLKITLGDKTDGCFDFQQGLYKLTDLNYDYEINPEPHNLDKSIRKEMRSYCQN